MKGAANRKVMSLPITDRGRWYLLRASRGGDQIFHESLSDAIDWDEMAQSLDEAFEEFESYGGDR